MIRTKQEKEDVKDVLKHIEFGDYHKWRKGAEYEIIFKDLILVHRYNQVKFANAAFLIAWIATLVFMHITCSLMHWI